MLRKLLFIFLLAGDGSAAPAPRRTLADVKPVSGGVSAIVDLDVDDLAPATAARFDADHSGSIETPEIEANEATLAALVAHGLVCLRGDTRCVPEVRGSRFNPDAQMLRVHVWHACADDGPLRVSLPLLERLQARQEVFLTVRLSHGIDGKVLTAEAPTWEETPPSRWQRLQAWWRRVRGG
ncbi:MAG TPA: hypothetical protein VFH51_08420 [Myxococcota bacterium]|nr:hypothetical protein [Myxococcota bacterium]